MKFSYNRTLALVLTEVLSSGKPEAFIGTELKKTATFIASKITKAITNLRKIAEATFSLRKIEFVLFIVFEFNNVIFVNNSTLTNENFRRFFVNKYRF